MHSDSHDDPKLNILKQAGELISELESANKVQSKISLHNIYLVYLSVALLIVGLVVQISIRGRDVAPSNIFVPGLALFALFSGGYFIGRKRGISSRDTFLLAFVNLVVYLIAIYINKFLPINILPAVIAFISILTTAGAALIMGGIAIVASGFVLYHPVHGVDVTIAARIMITNVILLGVFQLYARNFQHLVSTTLNVTSGLKRMTESLSEDLVITTLERDTARELDHETGLLNKKTFKNKIKNLLNNRQTNSPLVFVRFEIVPVAQSLRGLSERAYHELLQKIARKISDFAIQESVSRPSKWEFIACCEMQDTEEKFKSDLSALTIELKQILRQMGSSFPYKFRAGVAFWPQDGESLDDIISATEMALVHAHQNGVSQPVWYLPSMRSQINELLDLAESIRPGIEQGQFYFDYQPVVHKYSRAVEFYECLIRWRHPVLGVLGPFKFIPLAIEYGQIIPLTMWALLKANEFLRLNKEAGKTPVKLSVNIAPSFITWMLRNPKRSDVFFESIKFDPSMIILEITEESFLESNEDIIGLFEKLKSKGYLLALDDFGAGYSSLSKVALLPLDYLKMDMSLVSGIDKLERKQKTYDAMSKLGYQLGIKVVAEGVETQAELDVVSMMAVDFIQGFVISRPHPESQIGQPLATD